MDVTGNDSVLVYCSISFKVCELLNAIYKYCYPHDEVVLAEHKNINV